MKKKKESLWVRFWYGPIKGWEELTLEERVAIRAQETSKGHSWEGLYLWWWRKHRLGTWHTWGAYRDF